MHAKNYKVVFEVFLTFLKLGLTSFGGPTAHIGYFRQEFIVRRNWLSESQFAQLLALCQFLPGPASSQLGLGLGLLRSGWAGALAAFIGFTLPSAALLFVFSTLLPLLSSGVGEAALQGLKLVALPVVLQGVLGMHRQLCPDMPRFIIAVLVMVLLLLTEQFWLQPLAIVLGGVAGLILCRNIQPLHDADLVVSYGPKLGWGLLIGFAVLLLGLPVLSYGNEGLLAVMETFYRVGALVFGGGHVVLPLLQDAVVAPGWVLAEDFLAGYGAAQAVPGPMFTLAAFLGERLPAGQGGLLGAGVALGAIFLPGFLLLVGVLPLWQVIARHKNIVQVIAGVNAAVVGLLAAALYDPIWISTVHHWTDLIIAGVGLAMLRYWHVSVLLVVLWCVLGNIAVFVLL
ncbi:chromate efflux transporter [Denitrificimonas sp. JX-1]|uniref:Chromate efflux transporter n=1 Tax=Denitrificimonas halotolerans TaxID=3098930 RepID=A0ABU5GRB9_9GAMM|nr:chromate efflux transporter [Denitrificimonas sp. JX-1]MDY7219077.1 chromate efflux transporter [Denitrificimonas sp. JX-1]